MYERFTLRAREIVRQASGLAVESQQNRISADHVCLALLASDGTARLILDAIGADVEGLSLSIATIVRKQHAGTTAARCVIESAMEQAASCGHNYIGSEHLLLGLLDLAIEREAGATAVLRSAGITLDAARQELARITVPMKPADPRKQSMIAKAFFLGIQDGRAVFEITEGPMAGRIVHASVGEANQEKSQQPDADGGNERN